MAPPNLLSELGVNVTLETNLLPTLNLSGGGETNPVVEWLARMLQPTIRVNGAVLYAPYGEAGKPQA